MPRNVEGTLIMTPEMTIKLRKSLVKHEGYNHFPYTDSLGKITIGIGYNLTDRGLSDKWISAQYQIDIEFFYSKLSTFSWFKDLNPDRQIVLIDMAFMGWRRFLEFKKMLDALAIHDYQTAADEMLHSDWARQVHSRAEELANGMLTGSYDP
jgi:lysozyme